MLTLHANANNWRLQMVRKADPAFQAFASSVLERDAYRCVYCHFQARQHMEVVNQDGNFSNNKKNNLVTACPLCSQCFFMEAIGYVGSGGLLIDLPYITQEAVNAWCHVLFSAIAHRSSYASRAKTIYRELRLLGKSVEKQLGQGLSQPAFLGRVLIESQSERCQPLQEQLRARLRLLPDLMAFLPLIEDWSIAAIEPWLVAAH